MCSEADLDRSGARVSKGSVGGSCSRSSTSSEGGGEGGGEGGSEEGGEGVREGVRETEVKLAPSSYSSGCCSMGGMGRGGLASRRGWMN